MVDWGVDFVRGEGENEYFAVEKTQKQQEKNINQTNGRAPDFFRAPTTCFRREWGGFEFLRLVFRIKKK